MSHPFASLPFSPPFTSFSKGNVCELAKFEAINSSGSTNLEAAGELPLRVSLLWMSGWHGSWIYLGFKTSSACSRKVGHFLLTLAQTAVTLSRAFPSTPQKIRVWGRSAARLRRERGQYGNHGQRKRGKCRWLALRWLALRCVVLAALHGNSRGLDAFKRCTNSAARSAVLRKLPAAACVPLHVCPESRYRPGPRWDILSMTLLLHAPFFGRRISTGQRVPRS